MPPCVVSYKVAEGDIEMLAEREKEKKEETSFFTRETLEAFVKTTAQSAIGEITRRNMDEYFAVSFL